MFDMHGFRHSGQALAGPAKAAKCPKIEAVDQIGHPGERS